MFTYFVLDGIPSVPQRFVDEALSLKAFVHSDVPKDNLPNWYKNRILTINGAQQPTAHQTTMTIHQDFTTWVHEHLHPEGFDCQVSFTNERKGSVWGAHTDLTRDYTLLYLMEPGGDNAETVWYLEKDQPLVREHKQTVCCDYDRLIVLERVKFPLYQWVILNTNILHGVENIETTRISFQVSANTCPYGFTRR